ncbi:MAG: hypothetical protein ACRCTQ_01780 [Brevinemataceae bacterium]
MFSLSNVIRIYCIFSIVVMIAFFLILTSIDVILEPVWHNAPAYAQTIFTNLYVSVIIMSICSVVTGIIIVVFVYNRGINKYQDLIRRIDNLSRNNMIRLSALKFPAQDEFGNLGEKLNEFLQKIDYYDQTKTNLAQIEKKKFQIIADYTQFPILLFNTENNEAYIVYHNSAFRDMFLKKNVFIDNYGRTQIQYFIIEDSPVAHFNINNEEQTSFFDNDVLSRLKTKDMLSDKTQIFQNKVFMDMSGERSYECEQLICIPLNSSISNSMAQMLYLFIGVKPVEKKISNVE